MKTSTVHIINKIWKESVPSVAFWFAIAVILLGVLNDH